MSFPWDNACQMLRVLADDWTSTHGELQAYCRLATDAPWQACSESIPVVLGRAGLGWGIGLHPQPATEEAVKQEGDGRSPVGVFALTGLFGKLPHGWQPDQGRHLPYQTVHAALKAVDDPCSRHYNQIVDIRQTPADWQSAEEMLRSDTRYDLGIIVAHNASPVLPGAGSCIFIHVWAGPGVPTAGCTAMAASQLRCLAESLQADALPCLAQFPRHRYQTLQTAWSLP